MIRHALNMEQILLNTNANFAAIFLNGSVGEILIFANRVINDSALVTMFLENQRINYQNALDQRNVL